MKKALFTATILASAISFAQVGINTATPKATLDVVAAPSDITKTDGLIAPRITGNELKTKDALYTAIQTGAIIYATAAASPVTSKTINVTAIGYYYFDGSIWQKLKDSYVEPWVDISTNVPATSNTQNIYQTGKVSIGKRVTDGFLSIYDTSAATNATSLYMEYISNIDSTKKPWFSFRNNLGYGSFSSLSIPGDQAFVFSVDADATAFSRNALEFIPHTGAGGATPFGFKITDQGMFSFNAQYPTETIDLATGTMRIRVLPYNGQTNSIYTTSSGGSSIPYTTDIAGLAKTQTFTASRTIIADSNGVLGYVSGLPVTKTATGIIIIDSLPVYNDNSAASSLANGTLYRTPTGTLMVKY